MFSSIYWAAATRETLTIKWGMRNVTSILNPWAKTFKIQQVTLDTNAINPLYYFTSGFGKVIYLRLLQLTKYLSSFRTFWICTLKKEYKEFHLSAKARRSSLSWIWLNRLGLASRQTWVWISVPALMAALLYTSVTSLSLGFLTCNTGDNYLVESIKWDSTWEWLGRMPDTWKVFNK